MIFEFFHACATILTAPIWVLLLARNWLVPLLFGTAFVFVVLPIQADQDVFFRNGQQIFQNLQDMWSIVRGSVDGLWTCLVNFPKTWNRIAALVHAVFIVLADILDYDLDRDVSARTTIVDTDTYCTFARATANFLLLFIRLFYAAILLLIHLIGGLISAIIQIKDLSFVELLIDLGSTIFSNLLGLRYCFSSWEGVLFCICRGRWNSPFEVPSVVITAFAMCLNPSYDGQGDPIAGGLAPIFGALHLYVVRDGAVSAYYAVLSKVIQISGIAQTVIDKLVELEGLIGTIGGLITSIGDAFEDFFESVADAFGFSVEHGYQREVLRAYFAALEADSIQQQQMILNARTYMDVPRDTPHRREAAIEFMQNVTESVASKFLAELPGTWARVLEASNVTKDEAELWFKVLGVASEVLSGEHTAHQIADRLRSAGADFSVLARNMPACRKRTPQDIKIQKAVRSIEDAPRFVPADSSWLTIGFGTVVIFAIMLVLSLTSPAGVAFLLGMIGLTAFPFILTFVSGNALHIASAVATGKFDQALGLGTYIYTANYVGREYMRGGLINVDADAFVSGLVNEVQKDAVLSLQMIGDVPVCNGLVTPFCLPPPIRGENPIDRILGAIRCEQNAPCNDTYTVADCPGRARSCVAGRCQCWLYLPDHFELFELSFVFNQPLDCRQYGYTTDGLIPAKTGGLAWINVWSNIKNAWAGVGDLLAQTAHGKLPYSVLAVAPASILPIVGRSARKITRYAVITLAVQFVLTYANDYVGWIAPRDHGWSCMVANSGSIVLVGMVGAYAYAILMAVILGGTLTALAGFAVAVLVFVGRGTTLLVRWSRPYKKWYYSNHDSGEGEDESRPT